MKKKSLIIILGGVLLVGGVLAYNQRQRLQQYWVTTQAEPVPTAVNLNQIATNNTNSTTTNTTKNDNQPANNNTSEVVTEPTVVEVPESINLAIPFTSQAPHANWDLPYQEACEEASILMSARFLQQRGIADANDADQAIVELVNYEANTLHYPIDMTAEETAHMIEVYYDLTADVVYDWTWDDVKQALAQGQPVIFPAAGRQLGNPNFTAPGPIYHMIVIKGYTANRVITNDPGTRKGADYQYSYETLQKANHDWNDGQVESGKKVIIIVKPAASL